MRKCRNKHELRDIDAKHMNFHRSIVRQEKSRITRTAKGWEIFPNLNGETAASRAGRESRAGQRSLDPRREMTPCVFPHFSPSIADWSGNRARAPWSTYVTISTIKTMRDAKTIALRALSLFLFFFSLSLSFPLSLVIFLTHARSVFPQVSLILSSTEQIRSVLPPTWINPSHSTVVSTSGSAERNVRYREILLSLFSRLSQSQPAKEPRARKTL